ncbi:MAG: SDR family oxidoreductase [Rhodovarius sp.]|nr:SDR family oxidoreductase [Rhodovarius sp.]MCX7932868.1 SDR family oxidoreductase [Rhodovarius sp.]MDW8316070.1 SDR family oxidoreductase [Rhodovarius sp.]
MDNLFDLTGKSAIVTGGSRGIGRAIALRLAQHGARVMVSSRKLDACQKVVEEIRAAGGVAEAHAANISRKEELQALVDATLAAFGQIDVLVCNAAVNPYFGPTQNISDEAYDRIMNANVRSNLWLCQMTIPQMAARGEGSVIFISSIGGLRGSPVLGIYGVSKAADMALARALATEWGPKGVRINCIAPGLVRTDFARALWEDPVTLKKRTADSPLQRIGEPDEIAGAAVFLAARASSFMTGQTIVIDGGVTAGAPRLQEE